MFTEAEKVKIREYMGYSPIFRQTYPHLEYAITAIQAITDGGVQPDSSSESRARAVLTELDGIQARLQVMRTRVDVDSVDRTVGINAARGIQMLYREGRRLVGVLATILSTQIARDTFSPLTSTMDPYNGVIS